MKIILTVDKAWEKDAEMILVSIMDTYTSEIKFGEIVRDNPKKSKIK